jgi:hypothetical protein
MARDRYTSGQAAAAAGLPRKALRVYEQQELLSPAERTANGYRLYSDDDIEVLTSSHLHRAVEPDGTQPTTGHRNDPKHREEDAQQPPDTLSSQAVTRVKDPG